ALDWINRHDPSQLNWAIECLEDGAFIGATGLRDLDFRDRNCEWGIWIGPPSRWNRGYGTEACRLATAYAFRELGMEKVYLKVYETNPGEKRAENDPEWREAEEEVFRIAHGEAWLAIPQTDRDSAVDAALDALLAVLEREKLGASAYRQLAAPMAAALPWLLSGEAEDLYR